MEPGWARGIGFFIAVVVVLALISVFVWVLRRIAGTRVMGGRSRQPRVSVMDAAALDARRRLILIRRDNVEHLLLVGGPSDVVVERNIVRGVPVSQAYPRQSSQPPVDIAAASLAPVESAPPSRSPSPRRVHRRSARRLPPPAAAPAPRRMAPPAPAAPAPRNSRSRCARPRAPQHRAARAVRRYPGCRQRRDQTSDTAAPGRRLRRRRRSRRRRAGPQQRFRPARQRPAPGRRAARRHPARAPAQDHAALLRTGLDRPHRLSAAR
ncbi:MAG: flagellar biosynthetic protein FliO [Alphaproteobacteria bacterium]|nr:flagellar biosynthetic protein FliO [Alphaproteobacteria bacterium]